MAERSYRWLFWCLAALGLALDQGSKYGVFWWLYNDGLGTEKQVIDGAFKLETNFQRWDSDPQKEGPLLAKLQTLGGERLPAVNQGALFGIGRDYQHWANGLFALVSVVAAGAIVFWSTRRSMARDWALCAALGLILAGTLGNLYDRLVFHGVRDFLHFYWFEWPVFNAADCCLVGGAFLLLGQAFWHKAPAEDHVAAPADLTLAGEQVEAKSA